MAGYLIRYSRVLIVLIYSSMMRDVASLSKTAASNDHTKGLESCKQYLKIVQAVRHASP